LKKPLLLTFATLAGCTVGPNYVAPDVQVPASYAAPQAPGAAIDPARWWETFGDHRLTSLIERALRDNPDIAIAASRVRQARLQEIVARSVDKPTLDANAEVSHIEFSRNAGFASIARQFSGSTGGSGGSSGGIALPGSGITTYALGFDASWELDLFGGGRRQVEGALARTEAAEWNRRDAAVTIAAEVAQAYWALRLDQTQILVIQDELARQRRSLQIAGNVSRVGLSPEINVTRQRQQITSNEARIEPIRADIDLRIHALGILLGQQPAALMQEFAIETLPRLTPAPAVPAGLPSDLLRRRPDVRAAERTLAAATADVGVAVADLYPRFSLTGMEQLISSALSTLFSGNSIQLTGSGAVNFPLIDWGRRRATVKVRREDAEQAYVRYQATVLGALRDVEDALSQISAEQRRRAALVRAVNDADISARATSAQFQTGFVAQNEVLDAQVQVLNAREQLSASDAQLRQSTAALFKALGGGWTAERLRVAEEKAPR
jgi:NodT family efflux transporter outer membrane factor (OMF) lipoprotein